MLDGDVQHTTCESGLLWHLRREICGKNVMEPLWTIYAPIRNAYWQHLLIKINAIFFTENYVSTASHWVTAQRVKYSDVVAVSYILLSTLWVNLSFDFISTVQPLLQQWGILSKLLNSLCAPLTTLESYKFFFEHRHTVVIETSLDQCCYFPEWSLSWPM